MQAVVYAYVDAINKTCDADISIAYSVDRWWYEQKGLRVVQLTAEVPLYFALYLKDVITSRLASEGERSWHSIDLRARVIAWIDAAIARSEESMRAHLVKIWEKANKRECAPPQPYTEMETLHKDAFAVLSYIEGRRWLLEHLEKRLKMLRVDLHTRHNQEQLRMYLPIVLQYLYKQNEIELTSGVTLHSHQDKTNVQCERCGSTDPSIHTHYCSLCEADDYVCDTCYVMGVSKGCSLVLSRARLLDNPSISPTLLHNDWKDGL